jgi:carboxypeptidase family protein
VLQFTPPPLAVDQTAFVSQIVDTDEAPLRDRRAVAVGIIAAAIVLVVFAATLEPVQRAGRTVLGLAGLIPLTVTMSGHVTDESGAPIAHAFVRIDQGHELANTISDVDGSYRMLLAIRTTEPAYVSIGANGYEASLRAFRVSSTDPQFDPRLHPVVRVDAGATVHLTVGAEDSLCSPVRADLTEPPRQWPCRLVHISGLQAGGLSVSVVPDDPRDHLGVTFGVGTRPALILATPCCSPEDSARVTAGGEAFVQIVALDLENGQAAPRGAQAFTLRTVLGP